MPKSMYGTKGGYKSPKSTSTTKAKPASKGTMSSGGGKKAGGKVTW